jgi:diguanylate cyclase
MHAADRTIGIGRRAAELMAAYSQSAAPRAYELFYAFVTGLKPQLNGTLKAIVAEKRMLSSDDVDLLYAQHFCQDVLERQTETTGTGLLLELRKVIDLVEAAIGSTAHYGSSLERANDDLKPGVGEARLREIIETLIDATKAVAATNQALASRLHASRHEIEGLRKILDEVRTESLTDALTGIANRKNFEMTLAARVAQCQLERTSLVLIVIDIDYFKRFNDDFGHLTGDQVLRLVAAAMRDNMARNAILARFGGEEFAVILPGADEAAAFACAETIRKDVMGRELLKRSYGESLGRITVSLGVAQLRSSDTVSSLLERADLCMYRAKRAGRNRTVTDWDPDAPGLASAAA